MHRFGLLVATTLCAATSLTLAAAPAHAATSLPVVADWRMDEPRGTAPGAAAMLDSSGHGFDGSVNVNVTEAQGQPDPTAPARIVVGDSDATGTPGTAYRWPAVAKDPATGLTQRDDNRLALVPDDPQLDPLSRDYAMELRFVTGAPSPNLVQKGQSGPNAPLFKVEVHDRKASCTLAGSYGTVFAKRAIGMPTDRAAITPDQWHTIRCARTYNATKKTEDLSITVDGVSSRASFPAPAGTTTVMARIDSPYPLSIGGKSSCDPSDGVGCDYFTGKMDYVRVEAGPVADALPTAAFTSACSQTACTVDGRGSSDAEGPVSAWAWAFGDGSTGSGATAGHTYAGAGTYPVTLTVTDGRGATSSTTQQVTVTGAVATGVAFRASSSLTTTASALKVPVPTGTQAGDALVLQVATVGTATRPTAPAGWTEVTRQVFAASTALSVVWQHVATSQDAAGGTVPVTLAASAKATAQVLAYSGTATPSPVAVAASTSDTALTTSHTTPAVQVPTSGSWVVSLWTDKSSTTTAWTLPAGLTGRASGYGSGSGYLTTVLADEGAARAAGPAPARTATTGTTSRAAMTTLVLSPAPA